MMSRMQPPVYCFSNRQTVSDSVPHGYGLIAAKRPGIPSWSLGTTGARKKGERSYQTVRRTSE